MTLELPLKMMFILYKGAEDDRMAIDFGKSRAAVDFTVLS